MPSFYEGEDVLKVAEAARMLEEEFMRILLGRRPKPKNEEEKQPAPVQQ